METTTPPSSKVAKLADRQTFQHTVRTTVAAAASLLAARACHLPDVSWAVVTTIVVMQSSLGAAWDVSLQRVLGTLIGGLTAVALASLFTPGPQPYGAELLPFIGGLLVMGVLFTLLALKTSAYRFAGITLAIIMLPSHTAAVWIVAMHRFLEINFGIVIGMTVMAIWPEKPDPVIPLSPKESAQPTVDQQGPH